MNQFSGQNGPFGGAGGGAVGQESQKTPPRSVSTIEAEFAVLQKALTQLAQTTSTLYGRLESVVASVPPPAAGTVEVRPARSTSFSVLGSISGAAEQAQDIDRALQSVLERLLL
jgi:nitrate/nitrite-specific signal transduction histidine kinase